MNENELNMEKVMKDYTPYLYSIINHKGNGLTEEDMEEIISDTFLALWKNQERLEKDREMSYYLTGTIKRIYSKKRRNLRTIIRIEDYENSLYEEEEIQGLQLEKSNIRDEIQWFMTSGFASLVIEGKTGRIVSVSIPSYNYEIPKNAGVTRQEAKKVAYELLEKYKPNDDTGEYELITLTRNANKDEDAYIWYAVFYKKYGDLLNEKESIRIGWIPTINSLYSLSFVHNIYENNEVVISKEDAIKIAIEKDMQIETEKKIKNTTAEIRIESMNESVYLRENNKEEYESGMLNRNQMEKVNGMYKIKEGAVFYRTEERVRKVWRVII